MALLGKQRHLLGSVVRLWASLSIVGGEQRLSCLPTQDSGKLPGQIVRLCNAGSASQTTGGWLGASRIPHQEDPALLEAISHEFARFVGQQGFEPHRQLRDADGCPDKRQAASPWIVGEPLFLRIIR